MPTSGFPVAASMTTPLIVRIELETDFVFVELFVLVDCAFISIIVNERKMPSINLRSNSLIVCFFIAIGFSLVEVSSKSNLYRIGACIVYDHWQYELPRWLNEQSP